MLNRLYIIIIIILVYNTSYSQNIGINDNGNAPNGFSILDVDVSANNKGVLIPRLSSEQRVGIAGLGGTEEGLTVYDETTNCYWLWDGTQWNKFIMAGEAWNLNGNAGTSGFNFIGTTDGQAFRISTNDSTRINLTSNGRTEFTGTTDATGTVSTGVIEIANTLRLDGDEIITNTNSTLYLQNDNNGDLSIDAGTIYVDATNNRIGIVTSTPSTELDIDGTIRIRGGSPTAGDVLMASNTNGDGAWTTAGYGIVPIGSIVAWHGNMSGVPNLPTGWIECNGQIIADSTSPMNGAAVPDLNGNTTSRSGDVSLGRFLRGATTSGTLQEDHSNNLDFVNIDDSSNNDVQEYLDDDGSVATLRAYNTSDDRIQMRHEGVETRVTNMSVRWIIRVK
jgi:hypothetical protein